MSTAAATNRQTPAERRRAVLDRKGYSAKHRLATKAPTMAFYLIAAAIGMLIMFGLIMVLSSSSIVAVNRGGSAWSIGACFASRRLGPYSAPSR